MEHKITKSSPFNHAVDPDRYGKDPYHQHMLVCHTLEDLLADPFETNLDLRGREFRLRVHSDGLHVTAELLPPNKVVSALRESVSSQR